MSKVFNTIQISSTVHRIVESDCFNEEPFIYLIKGDDKLVLIDTGCGTDDILRYISTEFGRNSEYSPLLDTLLVINTHNHYDHVGCNYIFSPENGPLNDRCLDLCASSADKKYTEDKFNSLGCFVGSRVKSYKVTRWLDDGEEIPLSVEDPGNFLKIFHVPGHTPDSLCLYYPKDNRMFVGDVIYRWAYVMAIGVGACPKVYQTSAEKLYEFIKNKETETKIDISLSCGHNNDNLESFYMKKLADLLKNINSGGLKCDSCSCWFKSFSNEDQSLTFQFRRFRFLDFFLVPFFKLFYYLCCCWNA